MERFYDIIVSALQCGKRTFCLLIHFPPVLESDSVEQRSSRLSLEERNIIGYLCG